MTGQVDLLLVEDNPADATLIERYLTNPSIPAFLGETDTTHVESLSAAREALDAGTFDVVLLDLGLPESSGIETLRRVTDLHVTAPIIVLTGLDNTETAVEAIQTGAQDFLPKGDLDGDRLARSLRYAIERHKQERALERRTEQLDFFNSILRHDMLNGLNIIMVRARILEETLEDPELVTHAEDISEWSHNITDLATKVRSILDAVTTGDDASLEPVALAPVVEAEAGRIDGLTDRVDIEASVPETVRVRANDLLEDVVGNLLTNAVEHTDEETHVAVTASDEGATVSLRVADDGSGVAPDRREVVFERGEQGHCSAGSGFGLFFVSSMVDSYGGDLWVQPSDSGGAEFVLELPKA